MSSESSNNDRMDDLVGLQDVPGEKYFVSGWDDDDDTGIEVETDPHASPEKEILWAAENNEIDILKKLLESNRNLVNVTDNDGYTALHRAAYHNHLESLDILLEYGANIGALTAEKWTPLHSAARWNSVECIVRLLGVGADVNAVTDGNLTPLHLASASIGNINSVITLLMHPKIDLTIRSQNDDLPTTLGKRHGLDMFYEIAEPCFNYI